MLAYLIRRILYAIPILIGVNLITFILFFTINSPDDMARMQLGQRYVTPSMIENWKVEHGYDKPLFFNTQASGINQVTDTLFFQRSLKLFAFSFGQSDSGRGIGMDIKQRMWPSLAIAVPTLFLGLFVHITFAMLMVFFRRTYLDTAGVLICIIMISISAMFYIIGGQYLFAIMLQLFPISGYASGSIAIKFVALPVIIGIISSLGADTRWYRTIFLEESEKEYVKTARAKGLSELRVLFSHLLRNAMIPILTGVVVIIPVLFMGSLILESFFAIPGLGSYTIDAIHNQDFAVVRVMVYLGTVLYILGLILTDISYTLVDPRVRLE